MIVPVADATGGTRIGDYADEILDDNVLDR